jgi:hypothetical protein
MKKSIIILVLLFCHLAIAQFGMSAQTEFYISTGETVTATGSESIYSNEMLVNNGVITMGTGTLELGGHYTNNGTTTLTNATLKLSGSAAQSLTFGSNDSVKKIDLNKSAATATISNGTLSITDYLISNQGTLNGAGKITLKSNATKTAIVETSLGGAVQNIIVERYIPGWRAYRFISSPVTTATSIKANWQENGVNTPNLGTHITGTGGTANGFDATATDNPSMFTFDNTSATWTAVTNTNENLTAGFPYRLMVRGDRTIDLTNNAPTATNTTLRATGNLFIGTKTTTILNANTNGYSFIGNPYQCPVDMEMVLNNATNINSSYYYVWDPTVATRGAYVTGILSTNTNNLSGSNVNKYLQPSQACFVKTNANGSASLSFTEDYKYTSSTNEAIFRSENTISSSIRLTLYDSNALSLQQPALDGVLIFFDANNSNDVDGNDAGKFTNLDETFSTVNGVKSLSVESRALALQSDTIPLKISQYRGANYTLIATGNNMSGETAYLHDTFLQTYSQIPQNNAFNYSFSVDAANTSTASNRFEIVFYNPSLNLNDDEVLGFTLYPNPSKGSFNIVLPYLDTKTKIEVFNTLGLKMYTNTLDYSRTHFIEIQNTLSTGVYYVKINIGSKEITKKIVIE